MRPRYIYTLVLSLWSMQFSCDAVSDFRTSKNALMPVRYLLR